MPNLKVVSIILAGFVVCGCKRDPLEEEFFRVPAGSRVQKLRTYALQEQYQLFVAGRHHEPPDLYPGPIAERGAAAVPFLLEQLNARPDELTAEAIFLVFEEMAISRSYRVGLDPDLMAMLTTEASGVKDPTWKAMCLRRLQRIRELSVQQ